MVESSGDTLTLGPCTWQSMGDSRTSQALLLALTMRLGACIMEGRAGTEPIAIVDIIARITQTRRVSQSSASKPMSSTHPSPPESYLVCPTCLKQYSGDMNNCPEDGSQLRRLTVEVERDTLLGEIIDERWKVERKLGQGGMGAVYLAQQLNMERQVAIKVMRKGLVDTGKEYIERFLREANVAAQVSHPHMVSIFDFGQLPDGGLFIIMEYLDGRALADHIAGGELTICHALTMASQLCAALAAAHDGGIIHRDLKPDNIFLLDVPGGDVFTKVLDFGIAKHLNAQKAVTQTGQVFGTPEYMSPEQCRGESSIDQRSDLYALGCILYELVTGQTPFQSESLLKVLFKHVSDAPPDITCHHDDETLRALEPVIKKLLQKNPDERHQSALEVRDILLELMANLENPDARLPAWSLVRGGAAPRAATDSAQTALFSARRVLEPREGAAPNITPMLDTLDPAERIVKATSYSSSGQPLAPVAAKETTQKPGEDTLESGPQLNTTADFNQALTPEPGARFGSASRALALMLLLSTLLIAGLAIAEVGPFEPEPIPLATLALTPPAIRDMAPPALQDMAPDMRPGMSEDMAPDAGTPPRQPTLAKKEPSTSRARVGKSAPPKGKKPAQKTTKDAAISQALFGGDYRTTASRKRTFKRMDREASKCLKIHYARSPEKFSAVATGSPFSLNLSWRVDHLGEVSHVQILNARALKILNPQNFFGCIKAGIDSQVFKPTVVQGSTQIFKRTFHFTLTPP